MADPEAWRVGLRAAREYMRAHAPHGPWMAQAGKAARDAAVEAGYPPLTNYERRAVLAFVLGGARGEPRAVTKERVRAMREQMERKHGHR